MGEPTRRWGTHPDPGLEAMVERGSAQALGQALATPGVQADPYARLRLLDALCRRAPWHAEAEWAWLQAMMMGNRPDGAWTHAKAWPVDASIGFPRLFLAAQLAQVAAPAREARRRYLHLLDAFPGEVDGWQKALEFDPLLPVPGMALARFEAFLGDDAQPYEREKAGFGMAARLLADAPVDAFIHAANAQALKRQRLGRWQPDALGRRLAADASAVFVSEPAPTPAGRARPVFVVGLPRSGTTLLAALLSAHSGIANLGEQNLVPALAAGPAREALLAGRGGGLFADWYRAATQDLALGAGVSVDKLPENAEHVGLILATFPDALVLHIERGLADSAVSMHLRDFELSAAYACDPVALGDYARLLMGHLERLRSRAPGRVLHLRFEDLVVTPRAVLAPVLSALGLPWEERVLSFWRDHQQVATFSAQQVRSPLNARGRGAWRRFMPAAAGFLRDVGVALPTASEREVKAARARIRPV